jgi:hypothetical protein
VFTSLPKAAKTVLFVRALNQLGAFTITFLAILAGPRLITATLTLFGTSALISRWSGALLLDRVSPEKLIPAGLAATGISLLLLAGAKTAPATLTATTLTGLTFELYEPATAELLAKTTTPESRQTAYTFLGASLALSAAISGLLATALLPIGVHALIATDALTCLTAAALSAALLRTWRPTIRCAGTANPSETETPRPSRWRPPRALVKLTTAATAYAFGHLAVMMFTPFLLLRRGAPTWLPGVMLTCAALPTLFAAYAIRRIRLPPPALLAAGTTLLAALALAMTTANVLLTAAAYVAWAMVSSAIAGTWQTAAADLAPEPDRPRWFAFLGLSWGIAQPVVPLAVGLAAVLIGRAAAPSTAALAFLAVPAIVLRHSPERPVVTSLIALRTLWAAWWRAGRRRRAPPEGTAALRAHPAIYQDAPNDGSSNLSVLQHVECFRG